MVVEATLALGLARFRRPLFRLTVKFPRVPPLMLPDPRRMAKVTVELLLLTPGRVNPHWILLPFTLPCIPVTVWLSTGAEESGMVLFQFSALKKNIPLLVLF